MSGEEREHRREPHRCSPCETRIPENVRREMDRLRGLTRGREFFVGAERLNVSAPGGDREVPIRVSGTCPPQLQHACVPFVQRNHQPLSPLLAVRDPARTFRDCRPPEPMALLRPETTLHYENRRIRSISGSRGGMGVSARRVARMPVCALTYADTASSLLVTAAV